MKLALPKSEIAKLTKTVSDLTEQVELASSSMFPPALTVALSICARMRLATSFLVSTTPTVTPPAKLFSLIVPLRLPPVASASILAPSGSAASSRIFPPPVVLTTLVPKMAASTSSRTIFVVWAPNPLAARLTLFPSETDAPTPTVSPVMSGCEVAAIVRLPPAVTVESWTKARTVLRSLSMPILFVASTASMARLPVTVPPPMFNVNVTPTTLALIVGSSPAVMFTFAVAVTSLLPVTDASTSLVIVLNAWAPTPDSEILLASLSVIVGTAATGTELLVAWEAACTSRLPPERTAEPSIFAFSVFAISLLVIEIPTSRENARPSAYTKDRLMPGATAVICEMSVAVKRTSPVPVVIARLPPVIVAAVVLPISLPAPAPAPSKVIPAPDPPFIALPTLTEIACASISGSDWAAKASSPPALTVEPSMAAQIEPPVISL